jgi:purine-binding chemotaxis protein CheW
MEKQFLTFEIDNTIYGVYLNSVLEIFTYEGSTNVPLTEEYLNGVINLRGEVVPIIDIRRRFDMDSIEYNQNTITIALKRTNNKLVGIVVDAIRGIEALESSPLGTLPEFGIDIDPKFLKTLCFTEKREMVAILNQDTLLD